jgi:hypothetical protein
VYLVDIKQEALDAGVARIKGYAQKGVARGKLSPKVAAAMDAALVPTLDLALLADCEYVLEAASEDLAIKQAILGKLEAVVRAELPDRLRHLGPAAGADRREREAPRALLRQPPVLPGVALAADRGRAVRRRCARRADDGDDEAARQGADPHRRRRVLRGGRRVLQLHQRGRAHGRGRPRHAGADRQSGQRRGGRRRARSTSWT